MWVSASQRISLSTYDYVVLAKEIGDDAKKNRKGTHFTEYGNKDEGGPVRELNPGPLAPKARILPLDQRAVSLKSFTNCIF